MQKDNIKMIGIWKITIRDAETNKIKREYEFKNIIPTVCRTMIANNLTSTSPTDTMLVNYFAVGSGTTTPANANTTLETETYRNAVASRTNANNVAYLTGFINATEDSGTYYEAGMFANGTATTDTGVLVSRVLLNSPTGITKSATETLTVDYTLQIT
jgi:hypothetical protein